MVTLSHALVYAPTEAEADAIDGGAQVSVARASAHVMTRGAVVYDHTTAPPARLIIPAIDVDAAVEPVGKGASGNMAVPNRYADVGWYKFGVRPGEQGSAVMDGHVTNGLGLPGVFARLGELRAGDVMIVETDDGMRMQFIVRGVASYPWEAFPLGDIFASNDGVRLNLITCDGEWSAHQRMYDRRLVVFAELVRVADIH